MLNPEFSIPVSVEVSLSHIMQGIFEIEGLLNFADERLTIEYQPRELLSRGTKVRTVDLPLEELRDVRLKRRVAGATITMRPRSLSAFADIPIADAAQIVLKVKRADRKEAEALVSHIQRLQSFRSVPGESTAVSFKCSDVGLREIKGVLYIENDEFLVLDVQDALVGEFDRKKQLIKVAPRALADLRLVEGRRNDRLYIRPRQRDLLEAMPGTHSEELELKVSRKHREDVERLIFQVWRLSEKQVDLEEGGKAARADD